MTYHLVCLTTYFHYLLPTVSAVFLPPFYVYIPLDFHRFTIKFARSIPTLQSLHIQMQSLPNAPPPRHAPQAAARLNGRARTFIPAMSTITA